MEISSVGNILATQASWLDESGNENLVVFASRARIARNLKGILFPKKLSSEMQRDVIERAKTAVASLPAAYAYYPITALDAETRLALAERLVCKKSYHAGAEAGAFVEPSEASSILVNDEDHIRIQTIANGLEFKRVYERANAIEMELEKTFSFAYDDEYGFHTAKPANLGTGLKLSALLHLPVLSWFYKNKLEALLGELSRKGAGFKGVAGNKSLGDALIVYNKETLGASEDALIKTITASARTLARTEQKAREKILSSDRADMEDRVYRSFAILKSARRIRYQEAMAFLSWTRVGASLDLLAIPAGTLTKLFFFLKKAHIIRAINQSSNPDMDAEEMRAFLIRKTFERYETP